MNCLSLAKCHVCLLRSPNTPWSHTFQFMTQTFFYFQCYFFLYQGILQQHYWHFGQTVLSCGGCSVPRRMFSILSALSGLPGGSVVKKSPASAGDARDMGSTPGSGRSPGEGNGNPLQLFLPGKSHGQRSLVGYSSQDCKESATTKRLNTQHFPLCTKCQRHSPPLHILPPALRQPSVSPATANWPWGRGKRKKTAPVENHCPLSKRDSQKQHHGIHFPMGKDLHNIRSASLKEEETKTKQFIHFISLLSDFYLCKLNSLLIITLGNFMNFINVYIDSFLFTDNLYIFTDLGSFN